MSSKVKSKNNLLVFAGIGIELVGIELSMLYVGSVIDKKMGWPGFALAGLSILGLVAWLIHVVKLLNHFNQYEDLENEEKGIQEQ